MQQWDADLYAHNVRFVSELGSDVVELLAPCAGERILDVGCGDGHLTQQLVAVGCEVVAADASAEMVAAACEHGVDARVLDAQALEFDAEFDAVFSNAALHWMLRPHEVIAGVRRALKPGGRFVAEMGGKGNVGAIADALSAELVSRGVDPEPFNPWYFPAPGEYRALLEADGFEVEHIELFERPTPLPGDMVGWLQTLGNSFAAGVPEPEQYGFFEAVRERLRPVLCDVNGQWSADYVRLRFRAKLR